VAIAWPLITLGAWVIGFDIQVALLVGALLVVTGPTVIAPILRQLRPTKRVSSLLRWEGIVVDPIGAMLALLVFQGVLAGAAPAALARLADFASRDAVVPVDMTRVERIDFICAGALLNAINRIEAQGKAVQILGATPIVRALLLLIGISPRHFVKKAG
jgi:ABC-type transporter Mla MlaB component